MKYSEFINEVLMKLDFFTKIDKDDAISKIKEYCNSFDYDQALLRGMHDKGDFLEIDSSKIKRNSLSGSNMHTVGFDYYLNKKGLPQRSNSLICATHDLVNMAKGYGTLYVILPFDDVTLGVSDDSDIFNAVNNEYGGEVASIMGGVNEVLKLKSSNDRINDIEHLKKIINDTDLTLTANQYDDLWSDAQKIVDMIGLENLSNKKKVFDTIIGLYDLNKYDFNFIKPKRLNEFKKREVWFSGKCIAIKKSEWEELKKDL